MAKQKVQQDQLLKTINSTLALFGKEITEDLKREAQASAKEAAEKIKNSPKTPRLTGDYAKGWSSRKAYESANQVRYVVHNTTDYQLTHLLEKGHASRSGGRVAAIPHIKPVEDEIIKEYEKKVTEAIKNESK